MSQKFEFVRWKMLNSSGGVRCFFNPQKINMFSEQFTYALASLAVAIEVQEGQDLNFEDCQDFAALNLRDKEEFPRIVSAILLGFLSSDEAAQQRLILSGMGIAKIGLPAATAIPPTGEFSYESLNSRQQ